MNYYEHHLGDYDGATAHLTWLEDCAYRRLICLYYRSEAPLPADVKQTCRLVRAASKQERDAVQQVLSEFFMLQDDGWHHDRCDEELTRYHDKSAKARASVMRRWEKRTDSEGRPHSERNTNVSTDAIRTYNEGNTPRARPQTPDTSNQRDTPLPPEGGSGPGKDPGRPKAPLVGLQSWLATVKALGQKPVPEGDAVFAYAAEVGIPDDFLRLAWLEFRHRYTQPDAKRYRDWRAVFRKAVRGNWLKLWYADQAGQYALTTVGIQAQRAHDDRRAA